MKNFLNYLKYLSINRLINFYDAKNFGDLFEKQNSKWFIVPLKLPDSERGSSKHLVNLDEKILKNAYDEMEIIDHSDDERGWYRDKYANEFKNKKILDLGCGSGKDGLFFFTSSTPPLPCSGRVPFGTSEPLLPTGLSSRTACSPGQHPRPSMPCWTGRSGRSPSIARSDLAAARRG